MDGAHVASLPLTSSRSPMPFTPHVEVYFGRLGQRIEVSCTCPIGRDHDYSRWVELVGGERYKGGERDV